MVAGSSRAPILQDSLPWTSLALVTMYPSLRTTVPKAAGLPSHRTTTVLRPAWAAMGAMSCRSAGLDLPYSTAARHGLPCMAPSRP